uniref:Cyclin dependent kinase 2 associated protein 1 n=1 Tax=Myotis lucifugus TaxID=59463 RepID=G1PW84_MYOLU
AGSVHPPSTSMATSSQYRQLLSDYGPPSLGYTQGPGTRWERHEGVEMMDGSDPSFLRSKTRLDSRSGPAASQRVAGCIIHARGLVRECLAETERNARS